MEKAQSVLKWQTVIDVLQQTETLGWESVSHLDKIIKGSEEDHVYLRVFGSSQSSSLDVKFKIAEVVFFVAECLSWISGMFLFIVCLSIVGVAWESQLCDSISHELVDVNDWMLRWNIKLRQTTKHRCYCLVYAWKEFFDDTTSEHWCSTAKSFITLLSLLVIIKRTDIYKI